MGQGDKEKHFTPPHRAVRDDVVGKEFAACCVRPCPHPKVIKKFGTGGVANVSVYTCRRCLFAKQHPLAFGVICSYELENGVPTGAKS